jgi:shikimate dehydrogenase
MSMSEVTSHTRVFALLGDPVSHSLSPTVQNAAMTDLNLDGVYVALKTGVEELVGFMRGLARSGGGGNITLPHKEKAATVLDVSSSAVKRTGACNTFWLADGKIHGDNTDVAGFSGALETFLGGPPSGLRVLVLGAGGAARAGLLALVEGDAEEVHLLNRTRDRARVVARRIGGTKVRVVDHVRDLDGKAFDLVVNTTCLGLQPDDALPLELSQLSRVGGVLDVICRSGTTPFLEAARDLGIRAADGSEMLIQQGAVAFERWWDRKPSLHIMRTALERRLRR